jgi:hypothetical protein
MNVNKALQGIVSAATPPELWRYVEMKGNENNDIK